MKRRFVVIVEDNGKEGTKGITHASIHAAFSPLVLSCYSSGCTNFLPCKGNAEQMNNSTLLRAVQNTNCACMSCHRKASGDCAYPYTVEAKVGRLYLFFPFSLTSEPAWAGAEPFLTLSTVFNMSVYRLKNTRGDLKQVLARIFWRCKRILVRQLKVELMRREKDKGKEGQGGRKWKRMFTRNYVPENKKDCSDVGVVVLPPLR
jgi:hypothetical protein